MISKLSESRANTFGFKVPVATTRQQPANPAGFTSTGLTEEEEVDVAPTLNEPVFTLAQRSPRHLPRLPTSETTAPTPRPKIT